MLALFVAIYLVSEYDLQRTYSSRLMQISIKMFQDSSSSCCRDDARARSAMEQQLHRPMELPPGFRFHPTDEELITHYLARKVADARFAALAVGEADFNKCEPWDLPCKQARTRPTAACTRTARIMFVVVISARTSRIPIMHG